MMDELITRHLSGATTDIEARQIERWRAESADHEATYRSMEALWALGAPTGGDRDARGAVPRPPTPGEIAAVANRRRQRAGAPWRAALRSPWTGYGLAAAAVVALLLVRLSGPGPSSLRSLSPTESTASAGEVVTMSLSDGSVIRLAAATTVEFPPDDDERLVRLAGRAFFAVAPGERPFVVRTSLGDVTVHGTRFEVAVADDELRLVVVEGTVELVGGGGRAVVTGGQVAHLRASGAPAVVSTTDVWSLLDWVGGLLVFHETPLRQVGAELARHFDLVASVADDVATRRITAWFSDEPVDEVVSAVCLVAGASCRLAQDSIVIGR